MRAEMENRRGVRCERGVCRSLDRRELEEGVLRARRRLCGSCAPRRRLRDIPPSASQPCRGCGDRRRGLVRRGRCGSIPSIECSESACTPDSVRTEVRGDHPSGPPVSRRLERPTRVHRTGRPHPAWPCSRWGLPSRPGRPGRWCALTAPFHPYLCSRSEDRSPSAVCSLLRCPAGHPDWGLPSTVPCGVRTFLEPVTLARGHPADSLPLQSKTPRFSPHVAKSAPVWRRGAERDGATGERRDERSARR
jgi:hypothetical protein